MAPSPVGVLMTVIVTLTFTGLAFGEEIAQDSFPEFEEPEGGGFWGVLDALTAIVQAIWGAVVFFFNLITFNIPGAPWWIRVPVGTALTGSLGWSLASLIRGGS